MENQQTQQTQTQAQEQELTVEQFVALQTKIMIEQNELIKMQTQMLERIAVALEKFENSFIKVTDYEGTTISCSIYNDVEDIEEAKEEATEEI